MDVQLWLQAVHSEHRCLVGALLFRIRFAKFSILKKKLAPIAPDFDDCFPIAIRVDADGSPQPNRDRRRNEGAREEEVRSPVQSGRMRRLLISQLDSLGDWLHRLPNPDSCKPWEGEEVGPGKVREDGLRTLLRQNWSKRIRAELRGLRVPFLRDQRFSRELHSSLGFSKAEVQIIKFLLIPYYGAQLRQRRESRLSTSLNEWMISSFEEVLDLKSAPVRSLANCNMAWLAPGPLPIVALVSTNWTLAGGLARY